MTAPEPVVEPVVGRRVNTGLIPDAAAALDRLAERTGMKTVDLVNRALQMYEVIDAEQRAGRDVLLRDPDGTVERVRFL